MKIAACISAGNTEEVTAGCVDHHRAMGVDSFVILHVSSTDHTLQVLRDLERNSSDIAVLYGDPANQFNQNGQKALLAHAKQVTGADWILRMDSDERWFARDGSLKQVLAATGDDETVFSVPRFNIVWPHPDAVTHRTTHDVLRLDDLPLALAPVVIPPEERDRDLGGVPWVLTRIAPKCVMRNQDEHLFGIGGHDVIDATSGVRIPPVIRSDLLIAQIAFTSLSQFRHKLRWLSEWSPRTTPWRPSRAVGWHWDRYAAIHAGGPAAIEAEWRAQFLTPEQAESLVGRPVIHPGREAFARLRDQDGPAP